MIQYFYRHYSEQSLTKRLGITPLWSLVTGCKVCRQLFLFLIISIWKIKIAISESMLQRFPHLPFFKDFYADVSKIPTTHTKMIP